MIGIRHGKRDWLLTKPNTEAAVEAFEESAKINRKFDVPDLAGYNEDGTEFFIDKDCPETVEYNGREVEIDCYLIIHEAVEIGLTKLFKKLIYQDMHQIALCAEKEACEMTYGMGFWEPYCTFMRKQINMAWNKKNPNVPPNLFKKPYYDEREYRKLKEMGYMK